MHAYITGSCSFRDDYCKCTISSIFFSWHWYGEMQTDGELREYSFKFVAQCRLLIEVSGFPTFCH